MSITRAVAGLVLALLLTAAWVSPAAAPPRALPVTKWIEELASEDDATWRAASEKLWKAGDDAVPALTRAAKSTDADLILRARVILGRLEWGIRPDTPAAVVAEIERYRDGDKEKKKAAATALLRLRAAGSAALRLLLARENKEEDRKEVLAVLKQHIGPAVRERIVAGDLDSADALLETVAHSGDAQAMIDLAAFRAVAGTAAESARQLEPLAAKGDKGAAKRATYLYRAAGDLKAARRAAEKADDPDLLAHILIEVEDFKALAKLAAPAFTREQTTLACVAHLAGDRDGFEAALKQIPDKDHWPRANVLFSCGRPREAIETLAKSGSSWALCRLLTVQGRRREALELKAPADPEQTGWLLIGQAAVAAEMGDRERARKLLDQAQPIVEKFGATSDSLPGALMHMGNRAGMRAEAMDRAGRALDKARVTYTPAYLFSRLSKEHSAEMNLWWQFLRKHEPGAAPSAALRRLDGWFVQRQEGKDFDAILAATEAFKGFQMEQKEGWPAALARACVLVGKPDKAEDILKKAAGDVKEPAANQALGDFYLERRRWAEAAAAYEKALKREPTAHLPMYLRGVALTRAGKAKEGRALITAARLLLLGDESHRYSLAEDLERRGLIEERTAEQALLVRTASFLSVLTNNVCFDLADVEEKRGKHFEAAAHYRRAVTHHAFGGGAYIDDGAYVRVPAWAHQSRAMGLVAAGKLDDALAEARQLWKYLPEEGDTAIDLIRALDKAGRGKDADRVFAERYARLRLSCVESPRSGACHNRLAWLLVRCGRRRDEALRHATASTQALPRDPGVFDTLAEVRFQRGDKDGAVAAIRHAVQLARPGQPYFAAQLRRIQAGDRKAAVPPEERE